MIRALLAIGEEQIYRAGNLCLKIHKKDPNPDPIQR